MWEKPEDKSLECLVLHEMGANDPVMIQKIIRFWGKVNKKRSDWKRKVGTNKETYQSGSKKDSKR